jgi:hypothetical protein
MAGFLDRENERLRRIAAQEAADKARADAADLAERKKNSGMPSGPQCNKAIIAILEMFPDIDIGGYIKTVERHSGFQAQTVLYTSADSTLDYPYHSLTQIDIYAYDDLSRRKLDRELARKGIEMWSMSVYNGGETETEIYTPVLGIVSPRLRFCGDDVNPTTAPYDFMRSFGTDLTEPEGPGIGIAFRKIKSGEDIPSDKPGYITNIVYSDSVYVRLLTESRALVTGRGEQAVIRDMRDLDQIVTNGFNRAHFSSRKISYLPHFSSGGY